MEQGYRVRSTFFLQRVTIPPRSQPLDAYSHRSPASAARWRCPGAGLHPTPFGVLRPIAIPVHAAPSRSRTAPNTAATQPKQKHSRRDAPIRLIADTIRGEPVQTRSWLQGSSAPRQPRPARRHREPAAAPQATLQGLGVPPARRAIGRDATVGRRVSAGGG